MQQQFAISFNNSALLIHLLTQCVAIIILIKAIVLKDIETADQYSSIAKADGDWCLNYTTFIVNFHLQ